MHHSRKRRFSQTLIVITAVVVVIGAALAFYNLPGDKTPRRVAEAESTQTGKAQVRADAHAEPADAAKPAPAASAAPATPTVAPVATLAAVTPVAMTQVQPAAAPPATTQPAAAGAISGPQALEDMRQGEAKMNAGDPLTARKLLNQALQSGKLGDADRANVKAEMSHLNQKIIFSPERFPDDPYGGTFTVPPGGVLAKIAQRYTVPWELLANINNITPRSLRAGQTIKIIKGPFHAVVNKTTFTLDLYLQALPGHEGSMYVTTLPVGLGRDNSTPTGLWDVGTKLKNPKFWGLADMKPVEGGDPENPLGKYWISLIGIDGHAVGKESYGIHGTNDPKTVGTMCSHGCIRLRDADIALVYSALDSKKSTVLVVK